MWLEGKQRYNRLVWLHEGKEQKLKGVLREDMGLSTRFLYGIKKESQVLIDGNQKKFHEIIYDGQIIEIRLPEEYNEYEGEKMNIPILYEDEDIMVIEKSPFMVVHPTKNHHNHTLLNGLIYLFGERQIHSKIRFVNRLDRDTSGILAIAKSNFSHSFMVKDKAIHGMTKIYRGVIQGHLDQQEGKIDRPIAKSKDGIHMMISSDGQEAITHYKVLQSYCDAQLLEIKIETGRTHQIRVHFASLGHPLLGDELYGGDHRQINRQALHCMELGFFSPRKNQLISVKTKPPQDMRELLNKLD